MLLTRDVFFCKSCQNNTIKYQLCVHQLFVLNHYSVMVPYLVFVILWNELVLTDSNRTNSTADFARLLNLNLEHVHKICFGLSATRLQISSWSREPTFKLFRLCWS